MIVSCGDSFFYGIDLSDCPTWASPMKVNPPSQRTWPALIAQHLGDSYTCYANVGVGNLNILKQIISACQTYGNDAVYIINWTWIDRFDYADPEQDTWHTVRPALDDPNKDKFYYKNFHSELADKFTNLIYVSQALDILQGRRFLMTYMDHLLLDSQWHAPDYVRYLQAKVSPHLGSFEGMNFLEWSKHKSCPISEHWHPLDQAHQLAADYWLDQVRAS